MLLAGTYAGPLSLFFATVPLRHLAPPNRSILPRRNQIIPDPRTGGFAMLGLVCARRYDRDAGWMRPARRRPARRPIASEKFDYVFTHAARRARSAGLCARLPPRSVTWHRVRTQGSAGNPNGRSRVYAAYTTEYADTRAAD